jgi:hypothetical protein
MPKRSSKPANDPNVAAARLMDRLTGSEPIETPKPPKNPAAVALGRLGGLKGGKARAAKLTADQKTEIARRAAQARWAPERHTSS